MPYYATSQEWLRQSALLLEARPSTTRITTTYHLTDKTGTSKKRQKRRQQELLSSSSSATTTAAATTTATATPRASLTIKTYDPHSGVCLKYRTTKAAEVSRLILSLGQLGRRMAALPLQADADAVMADVGADDVGTPGIEKTEGGGGGASVKGQPQTQPQTQTQSQSQTQGQGQQGGGGGGGGKGKKKRGKK
ncbi:signal recognition particle 9 kDa protein-domain-containing protein [Nemania sp. NC0429]|nr:signal recognition particle 9 kDa protein-domain-containing protein [Nemania sp. NC0429]